MNDKIKGTGHGDKGHNASIAKKADRSHNAMVKQQGNQGQGGGLNNSLLATHCSTRLNSNLKDKEAQANTIEEAQASNPFYALQMDEDEESEDEESEQIKDMQILPAQSEPKIPQ